MTESKNHALVVCGAPQLPEITSGVIAEKFYKEGATFAPHVKSKIDTRAAAAAKELWVLGSWQTPEEFAKATEDKKGVAVVYAGPDAAKYAEVKGVTVHAVDADKEAFPSFIWRTLAGQDPAKMTRFVELINAYARNSLAKDDPLPANHPDVLALIQYLYVHFSTDLTSGVRKHILQTLDELFPVIELGGKYQAKFSSLCEELVRRAIKCTAEIEGKQRSVWLVESQVGIVGAGQQALKEGADVVVVYRYDGDDGVDAFRLTALSNTVDVAKLTKLTWGYDSGGNKNISGCLCKGDPERRKTQHAEDLVSVPQFLKRHGLVKQQKSA